MLVADGGGGGGYFGTIPGDPGAIRSAATGIGQACSKIGSQGSRITGASSSLVGDGWRGNAANQFSSLASQLARAHQGVESGLGSVPGALNEFAGVLQTCQEQLAHAETLMSNAQSDYSSSVTSLNTNLPADQSGPHAAADAQQRQSALNSIQDTYNHQSTSATSLATSALNTHQQAVAKLTGQLQQASGDSKGVEATLTSIGDSLGVPVAALSALASVALLRSLGRLATVGSDFARTYQAEASSLTATLGHSLFKGDMTADEAVARLVDFVDHSDLAEQVFTNAARSDAGAGGLLSLGRFATPAKWVGRGAGGLAILGDAYTIWHPDEGGAWGTAEQYVAGANGIGTAGLMTVDVAGMAEAGGLLAADATLGWVPVAGQVLVVGTGIYLMGDYLYTHTKWFHDGIDSVGHGLEDAGKAVGDGLSDAGNAVGHAAGSVAHFFGL